MKRKQFYITLAFIGIMSISCQTKRYTMSDIEGAFTYKTLIIPEISEYYTIKFVFEPKDSSFYVREFPNAYPLYGKWEYIDNDKILLKTDSLETKKIDSKTPSFYFKIPSKEYIMKILNPNKIKIREKGVRGSTILKKKND